jgi:hypothetical protein
MASPRLICSNSSTRDLAVPDLHAANNGVMIRSRVGQIRDDTLAPPPGEITTLWGSEIRFGVNLRAVRLRCSTRGQARRGPAYGGSGGRRG